MKEPSVIPLYLAALGILSALGVYVAKIAPQAFFRWAPCLLFAGCANEAFYH